MVPREERPKPGRLPAAYQRRQESSAKTNADVCVHRRKAGSSVPGHAPADYWTLLLRGSQASRASTCRSLSERWRVARTREKEPRRVCVLGWPPHPERAVLFAWE